MQRTASRWVENFFIGIEKEGKFHSLKKSMEEAFIAGAELRDKQFEDRLQIMKNQTMKWHNIKETPPTDKELVCKVKGAPFAKYLIIKFDGRDWWFWNYFNKDIIGWVGVPFAWKILEWSEIE